MQALLVLLPQIFALIVGLSGSINGVIDLINKIRDAAKQTGDWTDDMETQYLNAILATRYDPAWQPDPKPVVPTPVPPPAG